MEKKKQTKEEQKTPIGFAANPENEISIPAPLFMELLKSHSQLSNVLFDIKNHAFNTEQLKYYFKEDMTEDGKALKPDFWEQKEKGGN